MRETKARIAAVVGLLALAFLGGCAVGPSHHPPEVAVEPRFREAPDSVPVVTPAAPAPRMAVSSASSWRRIPAP